MKQKSKKRGLICTADRRFNLYDLEVKTIREALHYTGHDVTQASKMLGIDSRTIYRKLGPKKNWMKEEDGHAIKPVSDI